MLLRHRERRSRAIRLGVRVQRGTVAFPATAKSLLQEGALGRGQNARVIHPSLPQTTPLRRLMQRVPQGRRPIKPA